MDEPTPPQSAPAPDSGSPSGPANPPTGSSGSERFFTWLREIGIVRGSDRWFAGVAGGIAEKSGIDPLIVRGIFVVLAILGGPGILLYLAGWLLLPDTSGRIHVEELFRGRASAGVITWTVILGTLVVVPLLIKIAAGGSLGIGIWDWNTVNIFPQWVHITMTVMWWALLVPAAIVCLIIWLSRRGPDSKRDPHSGVAAGPAAQSTTTGNGSANFVSGNAAGTTQENPTAFTNSTSGSQEPGDWTTRASGWGDKTSSNAATWGEKVGKNASAWGETTGREAAARAKEWHEARRLGAGYVVLTLAAALIAAAGAALWALSTEALGVSPIPGDTAGATLIAIVAALAVCAVSLIIVGIRGRHSGWIGFFSFCGIVALVFTSILPWGSRVQPFGNVELTITGVNDPAGLTVLAGNANIDLSQLEERHDLDVWVLAGNASIDLPNDMPVVIDIWVGAGNISDHRVGDTTVTQSGPFLARTVSSNLNGSKPSEVSHITLHIVAGNADVTGSRADSRNDNTSRRSSNESLQQSPQQLRQGSSQIQPFAFEPTLEETA